RTGALLATAIDGFNLEHVTPGLTAKGPGIHGEGAAERSRNSGEKFGRAEPPLHALLGDVRACDTRLAVNLCLTETIETVERPAGADDHALETAVAHQQVTAQPDPVDRHIAGEAAQENRELRAVARIEKHFRGPPNVPGSVPAH